MQYDVAGSECPHGYFADAEIQAHLDHLSWTRIPVQLIYATKIRTAEKALRIRLDPERVKVLHGRSAERVTAKFVMKRFGIGRDAARRRLARLREHGLVRDHAACWPPARELFSLAPISKYAPRSKVLKKPEAWFHTIPRLLVTSLTDRALMVLLHIKHRSLEFWSVNGEAQASHAEIADSLKMSRRDVSSALVELKDLLVIEEVSSGVYLMRDIHAGNADYLTGQVEAPEQDLRWLYMADCRSHELDRSAAAWFKRFAPGHNPDWLLDDHSVAFWRPTRRKVGFWCRNDPPGGRVLVPPYLMPNGNLTTTLPWGYEHRGLRPHWGNKELETKRARDDTSKLKRLEPKDLPYCLVGNRRSPSSVRDKKVHRVCKRQSRGGVMVGLLGLRGS